MCSSTVAVSRNADSTLSVKVASLPPPPVETLVDPPSFVARVTCLSTMIGFFAVWGKFTFVDPSEIPGAAEIHSYHTPLALSVGYLCSLPILRFLCTRFLKVNVKLLLREAMVLYNAGQVVLNLWMVYRILDALLFRGHPFIQAPPGLVDTGATYAVWVHYCDKYLEFFDTYFMVLRGKMDQISFLHVYHHTSIAWAWWYGLREYTGGDIYFGALLNSIIHVMMYSYYTLSLLKISCPWKKYLTQAQLLQFVTVVVYSVCSVCLLEKGSPRSLYLGYGVQIFEMVSLFGLFLHFYQKAYRQKRKVPETPEPCAPEQASISSQSSDETSS